MEETVKGTLINRRSYVSRVDNFFSIEVDMREYDPHDPSPGQKITMALYGWSKRYPKLEITNLSVALSDISAIIIIVTRPKPKLDGLVQK